MKGKILYAISFALIAGANASTPLEKCKLKCHGSSEQSIECLNRCNSSFRVSLRKRLRGKAELAEAESFVERFDDDFPVDPREQCTIGCFEGGGSLLGLAYCLDNCQGAEAENLATFLKNRV